MKRYVLLHAKQSLPGRHNDSHPHAAGTTVLRHLGRTDRWLRAAVPAQNRLLTTCRSPPRLTVNAGTSFSGQFQRHHAKLPVR